MGKTIIMIPCRMDSERLPGKPLLMASGRSLLHHTYDRALLAKSDGVMIVTPDGEIIDYCKGHDIPWRETSPTCPTGTHRCAEAFSQFSRPFATEIDKVVNWQVDEPLANPADVDELTATVGLYTFGGDERVNIMTLVAPMNWACRGPNTTKVAVSNDKAHWFSRAPMVGSMAHCGIYTFHPNTLRHLGSRHRTYLSKAEGLEQLAWIEAGWSIWVWAINMLPLSVNTRGDYEKFKQTVEAGDA